jgi:hypothetical protein
MGYDLHITRAENWFDSQQKPITPEEWLAVIGRDPELVIDPRDNGPYFALWLKHSLVHGDHPWLDWFEGRVHTKYPDRKTLGKMLEIASRLGAKVQGDNGEQYSRPEDLQEG